MALIEEGIEDLVKFGREAVLHCGEEALAYYGRGKAQVKFDEGLVTEAEIHLRERFQDRLFASFPEHQLFMNNQAGDGYTHEGRRCLWIYDALDGVANFQAGIPIWGMSLALLENYWPIFGMFYMPATGDVFEARAGGQAFRGQQEILVTTQDEINDESLLLTYSRFHQRFGSSFPGKMRDLGSTAAHLCYVAMGRAEAAVIANESFQGLAAARIIVEAAGGEIYRMDGSIFFLNDYLDGRRIEEPLLVTAPILYDQVREHLQEGF